MTEPIYGPVHSGGVGLGSGSGAGLGLILGAGGGGEAGEGGEDRPPELLETGEGGADSPLCGRIAPPLGTRPELSSSEPKWIG